MAWDDDAYDAANYYAASQGVPTTQAAPVDAGGGSAGQYSQATLDIFKVGVGALSGIYQQRQALDYKRWEATNRGLYMQGMPGQFGVTAGVQGGGNMMMLIIIGVAFVALSK